MTGAKAYREKMKKSIAGRYLNKSWFMILASFIISLLLVYSYHTRLMIENKNFFLLEKSPLNPVIGTEHVQQMGVLENEEIPDKASNSLETDIFDAENEARLIKKPRVEKHVKKSTLWRRRNRKVKSHQSSDHRIPVMAKKVNREKVVEVVLNTYTRANTDTDTNIDTELDTDTDDSCIGKRIYMHRIPRKFNEDLIKHCESLSTWTDMCRFVSNSGLGPPLPNQENVFSNTGWFATNQFSLEVIFHNRMKQYKCLTQNSSVADAFFVPFYAGLDVAQYLWGYNLTMRDNAPKEMMKWLRAKSEWKIMDGRDHFMVAGRISWDFRRSGKKDSDWGNNLMILPESKKMTILSIESSPWNHNGLAIPYPTYFHPSDDLEISQWQRRMRRLERQFLYSFAGAPRPNLRDSIRNEIIDQCKLSMTKCNLLECNNKDNNCHKPVNVMQLFQSSVFCLQPPGDSFTRRSAFDSILAGCIPVFFHPGSAYVQYIWHLPINYTTYSVFIPMNEVKSKEMSIERVLSSLSRRKVMEMREEVIRLIPRVVYADPRYRLERNEDAFDLAVKGVLERVQTIRRDPNEGFDVPEAASWKYNLFGIVGDHEWDPFFVNQGNYELDNSK